MFFGPPYSSAQPSLFFFFRIFVWSPGEKKFLIPVSSLKLKRPNYPLNCYFLDISQNSNIKQYGIKMILFQFHALLGKSVEIFFEDKKLACTRQLKESRFYSSGVNIRKDLGEEFFSSIFTKVTLFR